jgi:hypothetical protein
LPIYVYKIWARHDIVEKSYQASKIEDAFAVCHY